MATIDTSIYSNLLRVKQPEEYAAERQQLQAGELTNMLNRQKVDEYQAGIKRQGELRNLLSGGANADALRRGGFLSEAVDMEKSAAEVGLKNAQATKYGADAQQAQLKAAGEKLTMIYNAASGARDQQSYSMALQGLQAAGVDVSGIPQQFDPAYVENAKTQALTHLQRLEQISKQQQQAETVRHNKASESNAAGQLRVAQGNLGLRQQELEQQRLMPKGQVVQSDQGVMLVDPRTGLAQPVRGPGGAPITRQMKDIPATVNTAMLTNSQNLNKIQQALDLLDGKDAGDLKGDKAATGWKGFLPNTALNRIDPQGVDARAMIADIGSLIIHDRSGAAVTAAESPRLMPFIPLVTDDAATAKKKLTRFKQLYEQEQQAMQDVYSKEQGYRAPASRPSNQGPKAGDVDGGYRFKGGDPSNQSNWEKVK